MVSRMRRSRHHEGSGGGVNSDAVQSVTWTAPLPPPVNTRYSTYCTVLARRDPPDFGDFRKRDRMRSILFSFDCFELIFQVLPTVPCSPSFDFPVISTAAEVPKAHTVPVAATRSRGLHPSRLVDSHGVRGGVELERRHVDTPASRRQLQLPSRWGPQRRPLS